MCSARAMVKIAVSDAASPALTMISASTRIGSNSITEDRLVSHLQLIPSAHARPGGAPQMQARSANYGADTMGGNAQPSRELRLGMSGSDTKQQLVVLATAERQGQI